MIEWTDKFKTGNEKIDDQHKELFSFINNFHLSTTKKDYIHAALALYQYTRYHFEYEEKVMREVNYPGIDEHLRQHNELISMLNNVSVNIAGNSLLKSEVDVFISRWVIEHIPIEDVKLSKYIRSI